MGQSCPIYACTIIYGTYQLLISSRYILQRLEAQFIKVILGRKLDWGESLEHMEQCPGKFVAPLKRLGCKAFIELLFSWNLHPRVTIFCALSAISFFLLINFLNFF